MIAGLHWDLLIAAASAGLLIFSARLLVPAAQLNPEDVIAYKPRQGSVSFTAEVDPFGGVALHPPFLKDDIRLDIRNVVDSKAGFDLLVFGRVSPGESGASSGRKGVRDSVEPDPRASSRSGALQSSRRAKPQENGSSANRR